MIEEFTHKYLDEVYRLGRILNSNFDNLYDEQSLNCGVNKTILYIMGSTLIGFLHFQLISDEIDVISLVIDNDYRNKGYATELLNYLEKLYFGRRITLEVSDVNIAAINLYTKCGFKEIGRRKGYYSGIDAIIMEKK